MTTCSKCGRLDDYGDPRSCCGHTGDYECTVVAAAHRRGLLAGVELSIAVIYERANQDGWCDTMEIVNAIRSMSDEEAAKMAGENGR